MEVDLQPVNSVPRFENAWMQRSKFPYTARSSAKVIRHAVSIDERRAKFRSDLISESKSSHPREDQQHDAARGRMPNGVQDKAKPNEIDRFRRSRVRRRDFSRSISPSYLNQTRLDPRRSTQALGSSDVDASSLKSAGSSMLPPQIPTDEEDAEDEAAKQDIEELWFPGCHADLGGGYPPADKEEAPLSHGPLVWMVHEAQKAGLEFDSEKMLGLKCCDETFAENMDAPINAAPMPEIQVTATTPDLFSSPRTEKAEPGWAPGLQPPPAEKSSFHENLEVAFTKGVVHDSLTFNPYNRWSVVLRWKLMEYMPFRRMDLRPDGSWKAISFPLPMGEVRDIPEDAWIHHSAIRRMEVDQGYRPGNLIIGGGGRGVKRAPREMGMGSWEVLKGKGDLVGGVVVRKGESLEHKLDRGVGK